jgi:ADP-ribosyl-[dinitrogen reductase] hydrolase
MIHWYLRGPRDVGNRIADSLDQWIDLRVPPPDPAALGNGGLMRAAAHGIAAASVSSAKSFAGDDTRLTHNSDLAADCSRHQAALVWRLINTPDQRPMVRPPRGLDPRLVPYDDYTSEPSGFCLHTTRLALTALAKAKSFRDGITNVVRTGGDTDTNAAVAGALLGAKFGIDNIPREWISKIDPALHNRIVEFGERFKGRETRRA